MRSPGISNTRLNGQESESRNCTIVIGMAVVCALCGFFWELFSCENSGICPGKESRLRQREATQPASISGSQRGGEVADIKNIKPLLETRQRHDGGRFVP